MSTCTAQTGSPAQKRRSQGRHSREHWSSRERGERWPSRHWRPQRRSSGEEWRPSWGHARPSQDQQPSVLGPSREGMDCDVREQRSSLDQLLYRDNIMRLLFQGKLIGVVPENNLPDIFLLIETWLEEIFLKSFALFHLCGNTSSVTSLPSSMSIATTMRIEEESAILDWSKNLHKMQCSEYERLMQEHFNITIGILTSAQQTTCASTSHVGFNFAMRCVHLVLNAKRHCDMLSEDEAIDITAICGATLECCPEPKKKENMKTWNSRIMNRRSMSPRQLTPQDQACLFIAQCYCEYDCEVAAKLDKQFVSWAVPLAAMVSNQQLSPQQLFVVLCALLTFLQHALPAFIQASGADLWPADINVAEITEKITKQKMESRSQRSSGGVSSISSGISQISSLSVNSQMSVSSARQRSGLASDSSCCSGSDLDWRSTNSSWADLIDVSELEILGERPRGIMRHLEDHEQLKSLYINLLNAGMELAIRSQEVNLWESYSTRSPPEAHPLGAGPSLSGGSAAPPGSTTTAPGTAQPTLPTENMQWWKCMFPDSWEREYMHAKQYHQKHLHGTTILGYQPAAFFNFVQEALPANVLGKILTEENASKYDRLMAPYTA